MSVPLRPSRSSPPMGVLPALLACLMAAGPAPAASAADNGIGSVLACRAITIDNARLRCFDRVSAALARTASAARSNTSSPHDASTAPSLAVAKPTGAPSRRMVAVLDPRQTFGLSSGEILAREDASSARTEQISSITVRITGLQAAPDGRAVYRLGNGQVWEELVADGEAPPVKPGDQVRISRGWLQSYWMQTASGRGCKVQRLR